MSTDRIEKQILLRAPQSRVWRALTDFTEFGHWFGLRFKEPFTPGAHLHGVIIPTTVNAEVGNAQKPYEGKPIDISIVQMIPQRLFSYRWHPHAVETGVDYSQEPTTLIEFTLQPLEDGVLLRVVESGFDQIPLARRAKAFEANSGGWALVVKLIEDYLAQQP
jgi:uncharacterized protein YndB with AHSA1/START domain